MSGLRARFALGAYRALGNALYPFLGPLLRRRARRGKEDRERRYERYGYPGQERPTGPLIWLHASSVGESLAIMPLVERLEAFGISLVLTTGTVTSGEVVAKHLAATTMHQYVPLDVPKAVNRFLDHWQPDLAIFAESEIWPVTICALHERKVPQVLVNARMSDRSCARWHKHRQLAQHLLSRFALVLAQSDVDAARYRELGSPSVMTVGNLKSDVKAPKADAATVRALRAQIGDRPTWIAASTHDGEEAAIARVHRTIAEAVPDLLTVLVPRHPDRRQAIAEALKGAGLSHASRSGGERIDGQTDVYLGDSIGEMGTYLGLSDIAYLGKSLGGGGKEDASEGGQNPVEPALTGAAILSGRYVQNFRDTYQALIDAGGARLVADEAMLAEAVRYLLVHPLERQRMAKAALEAVQSLGGASDRTWKALDPFVTPLRLKAVLDGAMLRAAQ